MNVCSVLCAGRHALGDQAGSEGGQTEGDQAGVAKLRKAQSKWRLLVLWDLPGDRDLFRSSVPAVPQTYFEDNPRDLQLLRHDKDLHPAVVKPHLRNLPEYLSEFMFMNAPLADSRCDISPVLTLTPIGCSSRHPEERNKPIVEQEQKEEERKSKTRSHQDGFQGETLMVCLKLFT